MRINKLQLNDFGKFSNKEIDLSPNINVIKGNNESGKSTIQKFIVSMLYGISKDKRKSNFTDYDRYLPWGKESFSGKIIYSLDNGKSYEVYRDFSKKNPVVYNENSEDITGLYKKNIKGSIFFEEQTGVDEKTMLSSMVAEQARVVIDQASENFMIQKIANIAETGDERISYENSQKFLTKKRNEEVGTYKTRNRPINVLYNEKAELLNEKEQLDKYSEEQYEIEERIKRINEERTQNDELLKFALKYKEKLDKEIEQKNKVVVYKNTIKNYEDEKNRLKQQEEDINSKLKIAEEEYDLTLKIKAEKEEKRNKKINNLNEIKDKKGKMFLILSIFLVVISVVLLVIGLRSIGIITFLVMIACIIVRNQFIRKINFEINQYLNIDNKDLSDDEKIIVEKYQSKLKEIELKIEVLNNNINESNKQVSIIMDEIKEEENKNIKELLNQFEFLPKQEFNEILGTDNIVSKINSLQKIKNNNDLEIHKQEYRKKTILPELEKLAEIEEKLSNLVEREQELNDKAEAIQVASQVLENAYEEMKANVVPKFTQKLSSTISKVSNGKYSKVVTSDKEGLLIEKENGEYVPAKALSMGTLDQLYLSLRFAIVGESTNEKMPIILDEAFAYFDNDRLLNILKYMSIEFGQNQILLFTCTDREIELLNRLNIGYKLIEM